MNAKVKKLWIKALRSGTFEQGKNYLRVDGEYCCLGVLCELYRRKTKQGVWSDRVFADAKGNRSSGFLPSGVCEWAGLEESDPMLGRTLCASELNDKGKDFNAIADRIEKYL